MLTFDQLDVLVKPITDLYEQYTQSVILDIARRLTKLPMTATAAWQMQRLTESGEIYKKALEEVAKLTGKSERELRKAFAEAGVKTLHFDDQVYKAVGMQPLPLSLSPAMRDVLRVGLQKTAGLMRNLTLTTANSAQEAFLSAADLAYMQVSTGAFSYGDAIRQAVKEVAQDGLKTIGYPSGRQDQLDVAMRRAVLTGIGQTAGELQLARAREMGVDLVETSAHIGARPTHEIWQGKVFSFTGTKYPDFFVETGYGTVTGLCGINCRHSFYPFFEGISESAYRDLQEYEGKPVKYNGKDLTFYDATQKQREIEREIRKWKREAAALGEVGKDNAEELQQVRKLQARMRDFVSQTGLERQGVREGGKVLKVVVPPVPMQNWTKTRIEGFPEGTFFNFRAPTDNEIKDFRKLMTDLPDRINQLNLSDKPLLFKIKDADKYMGGSEGLIIQIGDQALVGEIGIHESIHWRLSASGIEKEYSKYKPSEYFPHALDAIDAMGEWSEWGAKHEQLAMVLTVYSDNKDAWIKNLVGSVYSTNIADATKQVEIAERFLKEIGIWK